MSSPFIGEIRLVPYNFAPVGWAFCNGQIMSISQNSALFNLIGTTYGGDGQQTFALPNLQGRVPVHVGTLSTTGDSFVQGQVAGVESVTLNGNQMPAHTHVPRCNSASSTNANPAGGFWGNWADTPYSDQVPNAPMNGLALSTAGGSQPHDNMIPFLCLNFIISLFGIFPSRS